MREGSHTHECIPRGMTGREAETSHAESGEGTDTYIYTTTNNEDFQQNQYRNTEYAPTSATPRGIPPIQHLEAPLYDAPGRAWQLRSQPRSVNRLADLLTRAVDRRGSSVMCCTGRASVQAPDRQSVRRSTTLSCGRSCVAVPVVWYRRVPEVLEG